MFHKFINFIKFFPSTVYIALFILLIFVYVAPGERLDAFIDLLKAFTCGGGEANSCREFWDL